MTDDSVSKDNSELEWVWSAMCEWHAALAKPNSVEDGLLRATEALAGKCAVMHRKTIKSDEEITAAHDAWLSSDDEVLVKKKRANLKDMLRGIADAS
jgi:hypothetical protein